MREHLTAIEKKLDNLPTDEGFKKYANSKSEFNFGYFKLCESQLSEDLYEFNRQTQQENVIKENLPSCEFSVSNNNRGKSPNNWKNNPESIDQEWLLNYVEDKNLDGKVQISKLKRNNTMLEKFEKLKKEEIQRDIRTKNVVSESYYTNTPTYRDSGSSIMNQVSGITERRNSGFKDLKINKVESNSQYTLSNPRRSDISITTNRLSDASFNNIVRNFSKKVNLEDNEPNKQRIPNQTLERFLKKNPKNLNSLMSEEEKSGLLEDRQKISFGNNKISFGENEERDITKTPGFYLIQRSRVDKENINPFMNTNPSAKQTPMEDSKGDYKISNYYTGIIQLSKNYEDLELSSLDDSEKFTDRTNNKRERLTVKKSSTRLESLESIQEEDTMFEINSSSNQTKPKLIENKSIERIKKELKQNESFNYSSSEENEDFRETLKRRKGIYEKGNVFTMKYSAISSVSGDTKELGLTIETGDKVNMFKPLNTFGQIISPDSIYSKFSGSNSNEKMKFSWFKKFQNSNHDSLCSAGRRFNDKRRSPERAMYYSRNQQYYVNGDKSDIKGNKRMMNRAKTEDLSVKSVGYVEKRNSRARNRSPVYLRRDTSNQWENYEWEKKLKKNTRITEKINKVQKESIVYNRSPKARKVNLDFHHSTEHNIIFDETSKNISLFFSKLEFKKKTKVVENLKDIIISKKIFLKFFVFLKLIKKNNKKKISLLRRMYERLLKEKGESLYAYDIYLIISCLFLNCKSEKNLRTFFNEKIQNFSLKKQKAEIFRKYISKEQSNLLRLFLKGKHIDDFMNYLKGESIRPNRSTIQQSEVENNTRTENTTKPSNVVVLIKFDHGRQEKICLRNQSEIPQILEHYTKKYKLDKEKKMNLSRLLSREMDDLVIY